MVIELRDLFQPIDILFYALGGWLIWNSMKLFSNLGWF